VSRAIRVLTWVALVMAVAVPLVAASLSPLLQWRTSVYIVAGFAGILGLCVMLFQPLLAAGMLPGLSVKLSRRVHGYVGGVLFLLVVIHIIGLWITSPPDVIDALLFVSPTPFSVWGVIAMWCTFASAALAVFRHTFRLRMRLWRITHKLLVAVIVVGTVVHALKIEGAMETVTKTLLCVLVVLVSAWVLLDVGTRWKAMSSKTEKADS